MKKLRFSHLLLVLSLTAPVAYKLDRNRELHE